MSTTQFVLNRFVALVATFLKVLNKTLRWQILGRHRVDTLIGTQQPYAYATRHGDSVLLLPAHLDEPLSVLVSRSKDGELAARLLQALGVGVLRGSSSQGSATAFRSLCRSSRDGRRVAITVDGPRGPDGSVAAGVLALSQVEDLWVVPVAAACGRGMQLPTWDRCRLPLPWTRAVMLYGRPFKVGRGDQRSIHQAHLGAQLAELHGRAQRLCGRRSTRPIGAEGLSTR